jgi:hypothetical protein
MNPEPTTRTLALTVGVIAVRSVMHVEARIAV